MVLLVEAVWEPGLATGARLARWSGFLVVEDSPCKRLSWACCRAWALVIGVVDVPLAKLP